MSGHPAIELLSSYLDEEVTVKQLRLVENHLEECARCKRTLEGLRVVAVGVRRLESVEPPPTLGIAMERRLRLAALEDVRGPDLEGKMKRWLGQPVLAPAFAVVLALGAILYLFSYGLAQREEGRTRLIVASAQSKEGEVGRQTGAMLKDQSADEVGRDGEAGGRVVADAPFSEPAAERAVAADALASTTASEETDLAAKLEPVRADRDGLEPARSESRASEVAGLVAPGREVEAAAAQMPSAPQVAEERLEAFADAVAPVRSIADRVFVRQNGVWVERGLDSEPAAELVDLRDGSAAPDPDLVPFAELGRVRLRLRERVVEVVFPPASENPRP